MEYYCNCVGAIPRHSVKEEQDLYKLSSPSIKEKGTYDKQVGSGWNIAVTVLGQPPRTNRLSSPSIKERRYI